MGLSLIILSPLNCGLVTPIGHLLSVQPCVHWKCNLSVPGAWSRDALIVHMEYVALSEDVLSWLVRLEQSNQCWLKTCCAGWFDLSNQTSVDWRRAELAGMTWTIKPVLTEDVPSWQTWLEQSNQCWLKTCRAGWLDMNNQMEWSIHASPQSTKRQTC